MDSHFHIQGIFPTQGSNLCLLHSRQIFTRSATEVLEVNWVTKITRSVSSQYLLKLNLSFAHYQTWNNELVKIGKEVYQGYIFSPCLFKLDAEYIKQNAEMGEAQAEIKIARRNTENHRYADDSTLMAESKGELKSLLMKVKEESEKFGLELNT